MIDKGLIQWKVLQTVKNLAKTFEKVPSGEYTNNDFWINVLIQYGIELNKIERKENETQKTIRTTSNRQ